VRVVGKTQPSPIQQASPVAERTRYRSKTEEAYAAFLELQKRAGGIADWRYEAVKLRLPGGFFYVVDFLVVLPDGSSEMHETKGQKGATYYSRVVGRMKIKIAAETYPTWRFAVRWPLGGGAWGREDQ
jgi:hypothetical protein